MYDSRVAAGSQENVRREARRVGSIWKYLGLKDPLRNRRTAGQDGYLWIGKKIHIIDGYIYQLIGEGKWAKDRLII